MISSALSPLHERHVELGAKMADFGGWQMPIEYPGGGVLAEHAAVRTAAGLFDVSHLGKATVRGPGAAAYVNSCLTADLAKIVAGHAQYTLCCADDGGVIDDIFSYLLGPDEVFLIPNAANNSEVVALLQAAAPSGVVVTNNHTDFAILAVQGPASAAVLAEFGVDLAPDLEYLSFRDVEVGGQQIRVCRTGYTGEHGYELITAWADATAVWDALVPIIDAHGGMPAGLGARDTLRTEMGYPLHGNDLSRDISAVQAGATWAVGWQKPQFWGRDALTAERTAGPVRKSRGIRLRDRGVPRSHMEVYDSFGARIGELTSGTFSPTLKQGIGLALIDTAAGLADGTEVFVDVRGRRLAAVITTVPFVPSHVR